MPLQPGQTLGHYRILRPLGAGGMGEVYEAEDGKLGRRVALKILPEETSRDPQRRERFAREARAIAALNHPGIVTIHSVEEAGGIDFITMELLEGQTLRRTLPAGGLPFGRFLALAVPLAEALAAAHERGITHRDLKPENILIGRDGRLKIVDFGLAKSDGPLGGGDAGSRAATHALTEEGRIVGTVAYMSPEQAEGKPVDPRSDVFALGIIFYEMCTGERPFKGDTTVSILSSILKDTPPPVTQANASLPRDVARIVNRCLMKDPGRRFQSAVGLASELTELKRESDSGEIAATTGAFAPGPTNSGPAISGATAATGVAAGGSTTAGGVAAGGRGMLRYAGFAAVVVAVGVAGYFLARGRSGAPTAALPAPSGSASIPGSAAATSASGKQRIVVLPFENLGAPDDAYFAEGVTEEITSRLGSVSGLGVISRSSAMQYAKTTKSTRQIGSELNVDYVLNGTVRWQREAGGSRVRVTPALVRVSDDTQVWADGYDRDMKDIFKVQSEIAEQVVGKLGLAMRPAGAGAAGQGAVAAPTDNIEAYQRYLRGKALTESLEPDRETTLQGIAYLEEAVGLDPNFALGWATLSYAHGSAYNYHTDYSEARLVKARECAERAIALQPDLREGHLALGYYYYWGRKAYGQAAGEFARAAGGREEDPEALEALSYMKRRQGHWEEALAGLERAYALDPRNMILVTNLASTYQGLWRYDDALRLQDAAIALDPRSPWAYILKVFLLVEKDKGTRAAREVLAQVDAKSFPYVVGIRSFLDYTDGRYQESIDDLKTYPEPAIESQTFYRPLPLLVGQRYLAMGDRARAQAPCGAARDFLEKKVAEQPREPRMHAAMSQALVCLGRNDEAIREARLAADLMPVAADAIEGPVYLENVANVLAWAGNDDEAFDILEKTLAMPGASSINTVSIDPAWAPLRHQPRWPALVAKAGRPRG